MDVDVIFLLPSRKVPLMPSDNVKERKSLLSDAIAFLTRVNYDAFNQRRIFFIFFVPPARIAFGSSAINGKCSGGVEMS